MKITQLLAGLVGVVALAATVPAHAQSVTLTPFGTIDAVTTSANKISVSVVPSYTIGMAVVQQSLAANPLGGLTFIYQINNGLDVPVTSDLDLGFSGFATNVGYANALSPDPNTAGIFPTFIPGSATPTAATVTGGTVQFSLHDPAFTSTKLLVIQTNATSYQSGEQDVLDYSTGKKLASFNGYAPNPTGGTFTPAAVAPEPASLAVFGFVGMGLLGLMVRARRNGVAPMAS